MINQSSARPIKLQESVQKVTPRIRALCAEETAKGMAWSKPMARPIGMKSAPPAVGVPTLPKCLGPFS